MSIPYLRLMGAMAASFGIPPHAFWRMTPRELKALMDALHGPSRGSAGRMRREDLERLMERYPDGGGDARYDG